MTMLTGRWCPLRVLAAEAGKPGWCPLRVLAAEAGKPGWGPVNCQRAACQGPVRAWYDPARECCALLTLARVK